MYCGFLQYGYCIALYCEKDYLFSPVPKHVSISNCNICEKNCNLSPMSNLTLSPPRYHTIRYLFVSAFIASLCYQPQDAISTIKHISSGAIIPRLLKIIALQIHKHLMQFVSFPAIKAPQLPPPIKCLSLQRSEGWHFDAEWREGAGREREAQGAPQSFECGGDTSLAPIVGNEEAITLFISGLLMPLKYSAIIPARIYNYCQDRTPHWAD